MFQFRNKSLLTGVALSTSYAILMYGLYRSASITSVFSLISTALMIPSIMLHFLASLFGWVSIFALAPWAALTSGILLCIAAFISPWHLLLILFEAAEIVLTFTGYSNSKELRKKNEYDNLTNEITSDDLSHTGSCENCGRLRKKSENFSKYGLCFDCNSRLREKITVMLDFVKSASAKSNPSTGEIELALQKIDALEKLRPSAPFFKSSTSIYRQTLVSKLAETKKTRCE